MKKTSGMASEALGKTIAKVVAVALIIGLFSAFYCWSFWDPVGAMKRVPIGIVNLDEGVEVNGKQVNIGSEITKAASEGDEANFVELDAQALDNGIENSGYSMVFEIPADFSSKVAAGMDDIPQAAELEIYKNIRYNYIYAQLSTQIEKAFEGSVNSAIANVYVTGAYSGLEQARNGLQEASDASGKLADGSGTLADGLATATAGAQTASSGAGQLASGASKLADGTSSLASGANSLALGTRTLGDSVSNLPGSAAQLASGATAALDGVANLANGAGTLSGAAQTVADGLGSLSSGLTSGKQQLDTAQSSLNALSTQLGAGSESAAHLADGALAAQQCYQAALAAVQAGGSFGGKTAEQWQAAGDAAIAQVSDGASAMSAQLSAAASGVDSGAASLGAASEGILNAVAAIGSADEPAETLAYGQAQIVAGLGTMSGGLSSAQSGLGTLAAGTSTLAASMPALVSGVPQVDCGTQSLASGSATVNDGAAQVADASTTLAGALPSLQDGVAQCQDGAGQVASGASSLQSATSDGAETIANSLGTSASDMGSYVADPTNAHEERYGSLDYYGQGFSPFFMTTSLWLGALIIFFVIEPLWPKSRHAGRVRTVVGRLPFYALVCALEAAAVTLFAAAIGVLDAHNASPLLLFAYALGVSLSFMLIMQFLNMTLGVIGKALAVLILIFQLACSGGTLPAELGQGFVGALEPFLPFTYAIDGFREVITYANGATIAGDLATVVVFGLVFFALSLATWSLAEKRRDAEAKSTLAWNKEEPPAEA